LRLKEFDPPNRNGFLWLCYLGTACSAGSNPTVLNPDKKRLLGPGGNREAESQKPDEAVTSSFQWYDE